MFAQSVFLQWQWPKIKLWHRLDMNKLRMSLSGWRGLGSLIEGGGLKDGLMFVFTCCVVSFLSTPPPPPPHTHILLTDVSLIAPVYSAQRGFTTTASSFRLLSKCKSFSEQHTSYLQLCMLCLWFGGPEFMSYRHLLSVLSSEKCAFSLLPFLPLFYRLH